MIRTLFSLFANRRGQALLEFAFVLPIIVVFLLAAVDFGIAVDRRIVLQHAVREGARYAAVGGQAFTTGTIASEQDVKDQTAGQSQGIADQTGMPGSANYIEVCYEDANNNGLVGDVGDNVQVRAHYVHDFVSGFTDIYDTTLASIAMDPSGSARVEVEMGWAAACGAWPP